MTVTIPIVTSRRRLFCFCASSCWLLTLSGGQGESVWFVVGGVVAGSGKSGAWDRFEKSPVSNVNFLVVGFWSTLGSLGRLVHGEKALREGEVGVSGEKEDRIGWVLVERRVCSLNLVKRCQDLARWGGSC